MSVLAALEKYKEWYRSLPEEEKVRLAQEMVDRQNKLTAQWERESREGAKAAKEFWDSFSVNAL